MEVTPMGIEWYRDLSITLMGFVTTAVLLVLVLATTVILIIATIHAFRLYRKAKAVLLRVEATLNIGRNTLLMGEGLIAMLALIQGVRRGFEGFGAVRKKKES
jgi:hypothetical protein